MRRASAAASGLLMVLYVIADAGGDTLDILGAALPPFIANNFEQLVKAAADSCDILPLELLFSRRYTSEIPFLDMVEFTRESTRAYKISAAHQRLRDHPPPPLLIIYIPGWWNTPTDESSEALVTALLHKNPIVLVVDTRPIFRRGYIASASRVKALAHLLHSFITKVHQQGYPLSSIHLIGFSLGAHVAGMTGKLVQRSLHGRLGRIIALDPARPCFMRPSDYRLNRSDADFVQVVHSSAGVLGLEQPVGDADIYVNGVSVKQPECRDRSITLECDHAQAWRLYAASVINERSLMARKCYTWEQLMNGYCTGNETAMGYSCSVNFRGMFLYKSNNGIQQKTDTHVQVFNPFDIFSWFQL
ncbi:lipase member H-B-like [Galleria mellonella]|uniref:Lipase member H-B-like n=1 Tax=Galleria mellonella TaxID=7137 RepID=A0A6J1WX99_GALME|nr:lipase member H-B-like [Galleria mellonella]